MPMAGEFGFPKRAGRIPIDGNTLFDTSTVAARTTPAGPRLGLSHRDKYGEPANHQHGEDNFSIHGIHDSSWGTAADDPTCLLTGISVSIDITHRATSISHCLDVSSKGPY